MRLSSPQSRWRVHRVSLPILWSFPSSIPHDRRTCSRLSQRSAGSPSRRLAAFISFPAPPSSNRTTANFIAYLSLFVSIPSIPFLEILHEQSLREHLQRPALDVRPHEGIPRANCPLLNRSTAFESRTRPCNAWSSSTIRRCAASSSFTARHAPSKSARRGFIQQTSLVSQPISLIPNVFSLNPIYPHHNYVQHAI